MKRLIDAILFWAGRGRYHGTPQDMSLSEAMVTIAGHVGAHDSFCVKEERWRHKDQEFDKPGFQVSVWKGQAHIAAQMNDTLLCRAVERALLAWDADPAESAQ